MKRRITDRAGSILIVTLWIVALLSLLAYSITAQIRLSVREEAWSQNESSARELLRSLSSMAVRRALQDNDPKVDAYKESWGRRYEASNEALSQEFEDQARHGKEFKLTLIPIDECGRINVNWAPEPVLREALRECGEEANARTVAKAIIDWRDPDHDGGAEGEQVRADRRYFPANEDFLHVEELMFVPGVTPRLFFGEDADRDAQLDAREDDGDTFLPSDNADGKLQPGLRHVFTTYGPGRININGASKWVLNAVFRVILPPAEAEHLAESVIRKRTGPDGVEGTEDDRPFESEQDVRQELGDVYRSLLRSGVEFDVKTEALRYFLQVELLKEGLTLRGELVVTREDGKIRVTEWRTI